MSRNPHWTRDELILALDLYFVANPSHTSERDPAIVALSSLLRELPIHDQETVAENFRSPDSVYMKLCNFRRLDPHSTAGGLAAGAQGDRLVWDEFAHDRPRLTQVAAAIRAGAAALPPEAPEVAAELDEAAFPEGRVLTRLHLLRERNQTLVQTKKQQVLAQTGRLACEACTFDFAARYGDLGQGFAECHHLLPLAQLQPATRTRLADLAIVCANCHRMLHRARPVLTLPALRAHLR
ncbi:MAG TPA: HNH endonuclease [Herpetosiphonaceae bacterium]